MYLEHFDFAVDPFPPGASAEHHYASPTQLETLAALSRAIEQRQGLILLTGPPQVGKSTVLRELCRRKLHGDVIKIAPGQAMVPFSRLLIDIHQRLFPEQTPAASLPALMGQLRRELKRSLASSWNILVVLDEAHLVPAETLAQIDQLLSIRGPEGHMVQVVLSGGTELRRRLEEPALHHLGAAIGDRVELQPWSDAEAMAYLQHRLRVAARSPGGPPAIEAAGLDVVVRSGGGLPGTLNRLCHDALQLGQRRRERPVSRSTVLDSLLRNQPTRPITPRRRAAMVSVPLAVLGAVACWWWLTRGPLRLGTSPDATVGRTSEDAVAGAETAAAVPAGALPTVQAPAAAAPLAVDPAGAPSPAVPDGASRGANDPPAPEQAAAAALLPVALASPADDQPATAASGGSRLSIVAYPAAEVWIDGELIGMTPITARLVAVGRHQIEVAAGDHRQSRFEIVREREHKQLLFRLDQPVEGR